MSTTPAKNTSQSVSSSPASIEPPTQIGRLMADHSDDDEDPMAQAQADLLADEYTTGDIGADAADEYPSPPTQLGRFMADHSSDDEDPMAQAQVDLLAGEWEMGDIGEGPADDYPSPPATQRVVSAHNARPDPNLEDDDFEEITRADIAELNDAASQHEQHVRNMAKHIVPPYPIPPQHASMADLADTSRKAQVHRFEMCMRQHYPGSLEERKKAMERAVGGFPRLGMSTANVRIVHINGETREVSKWDKEAKCDETCPGYKGKGLFGKLKAASGKWFS